MKRIFVILVSVILFSCQDKKSETEREGTMAVPSAEPVKTEAETPKPLPEYAYPVIRSHWKIGDPNNTKIVLDMYRAWDDRNGGAVGGFFADSADLDLPQGKRMTLSKNNVYETMIKSRNQYTNTSNEILHALSLHNDDLNEDWVQIMTYNKWNYKDGGRDSTLYFDNWRMKDGKIVYLNSLEQTPPKQLLKKFESR